MTLARDVLLAVVGILSLGALVAARVSLFGDGPSVREWYGLDPANPVDIPVVWLWLTNMLVLVVAFACAFMSTQWRRYKWIWDGVLAWQLGMTVVLVGLAVGAYGWSLVRAIAPHAIFELLALSVAIASYLDARRSGEWRRQVQTACGGIVVVLLLVGAVVESR